VSPRAVSEKLVCRVNWDSADMGSMQVSSDCQRVAYVMRAGPRKSVVLDGKAGRQYADVSSLLFSPDGRHIAYVASEAGKSFVVFDRIEGRHYDGVAESSLVFRPDGQQVAFVASVGIQQVVVVGEKEEKRYDGILKSSLVFSPDGKHVAYAVHSGDKGYVVVDGKAGRDYDGIGEGTLSFGADGRHLIYTAQKGKKCCVVLDSMEGRRYDAVGQPLFSPDGTRIAYPAMIAGGDTVRGTEAEGRSVGAKEFIVGARGVEAYLLPDKWFVVLDSSEQKRYENIQKGSLAFSSDGIHLAFTVVTFEGGGLGSSLSLFPEFLPPTERWFVVVDGKESKRYDGIFEKAIFSLDGKRVAFVALEGWKHWVVIDGVETKSYEGIGAGSIRFSPDGKRVAYCAKRGESYCVVGDSKEGRQYDGIGGLCFSPDGQHLAYVGRLHNQRFVVVDSAEGKSYDNIVSGGGAEARFDPAGRMRYLAVQKQSNRVWSLYYVEEKPGE
jgi:Tol biopolymer transport system component